MEKNEVKFFLSANTPQGFVSRFSELINPTKGHRTFILKGPPACGKSTLMRKIANHFSEMCTNIEYIYCVGSPSSLDAIILHDIGVSVVDGTSPQENVFTKTFL